jgi:1-acyl-sn-glycerol-3-phosphate acyltransferase
LPGNLPFVLARLVRTAYGLSALLAVTLVLAPTAYLVARRNPTSPLLESIIGLWARSILRAAGLSYRVEGAHHLQPGRSYVVVSNHVSNLDPMLHLAGTPVPVRFLAKKELFRIPLFGAALRAVGVVETDRTAGHSAHANINRQVREVVELGRSLVIYAEGTRSRDGSLRPFKKGAFMVAIRAKLPVVPCAIRGTYEAWRPGDWRLRGGQARMAFFDPIPTDQMTTAHADGLRQQVHEIVAKGYQSLVGSPPAPSGAGGYAGHGGPEDGGFNRSSPPAPQEEQPGPGRG